MGSSFLLQINCYYKHHAGVISLVNLNSTNQEKEKVSICNLTPASVIECTAQAGTEYVPSPASPPATAVTSLIGK